MVLVRIRSKNLPLFCKLLRPSGSQKWVPWGKINPKLSFEPLIRLKHFFSFATMTQRARMIDLTIKCLDMIFLTLASKDPQKLKKAKKIFEGQIKGHHPILSSPHNYFCFFGPFWSQNSSIAIFFISKAFKAKKTTKCQKLLTWERGKV